MITKDGNPNPTRQKKLNSEGKCYYCERKMSSKEKMLNETKDHVIPKSKLKPGQKTPLVKACFQCNTMKSSLSFRYFCETIQYLKFEYGKDFYDNPQAQHMVKYLKSIGHGTKHLQT